MARRPADRFPDGAALRDAVDALAADSRAAGPERHPTMLLAGDRVGTAPPEPDASSATEEVTPGRHRSESGRSRAAIAAGAALLLALVVAGALLLSPDGSGTAAPTVPSPATGTGRGAAPATVPIAADEFVGRQVDEVQARLTALGLAFRLVPTETTDLPDGQVIALDPVGNLDPGQLVVVTYAAAPAGGPTTAPPTSAAPTSTARSSGAPTSEPTSAPTTSSGSDGPGEGRGNGRGNGRGHDG
jgi:hypothetical protein